MNCLYSAGKMVCPYFNILHGNKTKKCIDCNYSKTTHTKLTQMKNYIYLDGKKIELSDETVKNLKDTILKKDSKYFDLYKLPKYPFTNEQAKAAGFKSNSFFQVRYPGTYGGKGFCLGKTSNWEIVNDGSVLNPQLILLPTKK